MFKKSILILTIFSLLISGYQFSGGDQSTYVPIVLRHLNPQLFQNDYLASAQEGQLSLMFPLMASIISFTSINIEYLYLTLFIICLYLTLLLIYKIAFHLTKNRPTALIATALLSLPKYVGATNNQTLDISLVPRFFVYPLFLYAFHLMLRKRYTLSSLIAGIIFIFHPYSAIYLVAFIFTFILFETQKLNKLFKAALAGFIPSLPFVISKAPGLVSSNPTFMIGDWHQITTSRMPYLLISNWSLTGWISLILPLSFLYYYLTKQSKTKYAQVIIKSLIAASSITLIHIIFGEVLKLSLVLQLQLLRIWLLPVILGYIAAAWIIKNTRFKLISAFLFIAIISNFSKQKIKVIEWPGSGSTQAIKVQKWLKSNTPHDALIIAPPLRAGFRIHSQRSIVVSIKDGSSGLYLQGLASSWHQRMKDVRNLASKPQAEIKYLKDKYNADYLVTFKPQYYPDFTKEFETDILVVYKL